MATESTSQTQEELSIALKSRLIASGEYEKILNLLKERLVESGWEDQLRSSAREKAKVKDLPNLNTLVKQVETDSLNSVPDEVQTEIKDLLRQFVEKNVEGS